MRIADCVIVLMVSCALSACGKSPEKAGKIPDASAAGSGYPKASATAAEVAKEVRGDVDCPAKISLAPRAAGAPVDDVVGVRPGMTYEEAAAVVLCSNELLVEKPETSAGVQIQTYGQTVRQGFSAQFAEPRVEKTSQQIMQEMQDNAMRRTSNRVVRDIKPGQSEWFVGTMGMPGKERVTSVARREWFEAAHNPSIASIEKALMGKYGTPTKRQGNGPNQYRNLIWAYDPLGRLVTETSPLFNQCNGASDPNGGANFSPDCGIVVSAAIYAMPDNPDLSQYMQVGVVDQAGGYEAIMATEKGLQQIDAQRRAKEVEEAAKNANAPKL